MLIIKTGYAAWMGGVAAMDTLVAQVSYNRQYDAQRPGSKVTAHTLRANCLATNLNFPQPTLISVSTVNSTSQWFAALGTIPQLVYEDLNTPVYEGEIELTELNWSGTVVMGNCINLTGNLAEYTDMDAPIQRISGTVRTGRIALNLSVGLPNRTTPAQFKSRMAAAHWRYTTAYCWQSNLSPSMQIEHTQQEGSDATDSGHPAHARHQVNDPNVQPNAPAGQTGSAWTDGGAGVPAIGFAVFNPDGSIDATQPQMQLSAADVASTSALN
jgi:hypothetical protein